MVQFNRRHLMALGAAFATSPTSALAEVARETLWDELIPPGVPYGEIIGEGKIDEVNDTWLPEFDANARLLNESLDGAYIRMPGFILPLKLDTEGVTEFLLVPYIGACIHVPPPPPNQLVMVRSSDPWPGDQLWDAIWVTGRMQTEFEITPVAEAGYSLAADRLELYEW